MTNVTNTLNLSDVYAEGDILLSVIDPAWNLVVMGGYMVNPSWMSKNVKFANATKDMLSEIGEDYTSFDPATLWEDEFGLTVRERFAQEGMTVPTPIKKKGKKGMGVLPVDYKTVYSHLRSADDVVTTDIPEAVGYEPGQAEMWKDYLAGGDGALNDTRLSHALFDEGWVSDCCGAYRKTVAGIDLCKTCGGFFTASAQKEGA